MNDINAARFCSSYFMKRRVQNVTSCEIDVSAL